MEILKFEDAPAPKRAASKKRGVNSSRKTILGIAAAAAIAVVGSTLAANISINTGNNGNLEFGQGLTNTTACSGSNNVIVTPTATFNNTAGAFYMSSLSVAIGTTVCNGNTFTIQAWDSSTATAQNISTIGGTAYNLATFTYSTGSTPVSSKSVSVASSGGTAGTATIAFGTGTGVATSGQIYKLTIQSQ